MTEEESRKEFEAMALRRAGQTKYPYMSYVLARDADGSYRTSWVDCAWMGWQWASSKINQSEKGETTCVQ